MEEKRAGTSVFSQKREEMNQTVTHGQDLAGQRVEKGGIPTQVAQTSSLAGEQGPAKQSRVMAGNKKIGWGHSAGFPVIPGARDKAGH